MAKLGDLASLIRSKNAGPVVLTFDIMFDEPEVYSRRLRLPYIGMLRDAQNYVRAYARGMGIFELPEYLAWPDWAQWASITSWLDSKRSQP